MKKFFLSFLFLSIIFPLHSFALGTQLQFEFATERSNLNRKLTIRNAPGEYMSVHAEITKGDGTACQANLGDAQFANGVARFDIPQHVDLKLCTLLNLVIVKTDGSAETAQVDVTTIDGYEYVNFTRTVYVGTPSVTLQQTNGSPKHWYYQIQATFNRSPDNDVYLVAWRRPKSGGQEEYADLCRIPSGGMSNVSVLFPDSSNTNCHNNLVDRDFFKSGYDYRFYLSDRSWGLNVDADEVLLFPDREIPGESSSTGNSVSFDIGNASFARITKDGKEVWGLHIEPQEGGKVKRTKDETIYLILRRKSDNRKQALCKFEGGATEFSGPSFPGCFLGDRSKLFNFYGTTYGIIDIIEQGKSYEVYFSSDLDGDNSVSQVKDIGKAIPVGEIVIDPNLSVEVKRKNEGSYFHIEGKVAKAKPANAESNAVLKLSLIDEQQHSFPLGEVEYEKGRTFSFDSVVLDPGRYALRVSFSHGGGTDILQTIPLSQAIPGKEGGNQGSGEAGGGESIGDAYSDYTSSGEKSLVPLDCGYNLGEGGRMCVLNDFIRMIRRIISYIFIIMIPLAAIVFAYSGYLLLSSGGNTQKREAAKKAIQNLLIGIAIFLLAWVIINLVVSTLGLKSDFNIFFGS